MTTPRIDRLDRNLLINGAMCFAQEKPTGTIIPTASMAYGCHDQWMYKINGAITTPTVEREDLGVLNKVSDRYNMKFTGSHIAGTSFEFQQRVESIFAGDFAGLQCSLAMEVYTESLNTITPNLSVPNSSDDFSSMQTATSLTPKTVTVGSWQTVVWENFTVPVDSYKGLLVNFSASNPTVLAVAKMFKVRKVRLVIGAKAPSEYCWAGRNWANELQLCQRYFEKSCHIDVDYNSGASEARYVGMGDGSPTRLYHAGSDFKVSKRVIPTIRYYTTNGTNSGTYGSLRVYNGAAGDSVSISQVSPSKDTACQNYVQASSGVQGTIYVGSWVVNARL